MTKTRPSLPGKPAHWLILGIVACLLLVLILSVMVLNTRHLPTIKGQVYAAQTSQPIDQAIVLGFTQKYRIIEMMSLRGSKPTPVRMDVSQSDASGMFALPGQSLRTLNGNDLQEIFIYKPGYLTGHYSKGTGTSTLDVTFDRAIDLPVGVALPMIENLNAVRPDVSAVSLLGRLYWFAYYFHHVAPQTFETYSPLLRQLNQQLHQDEAFILSTLQNPDQVTLWREYLDKFDRVLYPKATSPAE